MRKFKIEMKWALIFSIMVLIWVILERLTGLHDEHIDQHHIFTNFMAIPAIAIYVFALLDKRKNFYHGVMTYKQGFVTGLIITLIVTVLTPVTQYITVTIISPDYFTNVIPYVISEGKMTQDEAQNYFNMESYIFYGLIGALIMGIITTVIVAIFTKKAVRKFETVRRV